MNYNDFLRTKKISSPDCGFKIESNGINKQLFPFQRDIVLWALRRGRAAIFADCGLGKTPMQLEWANHVLHETKKSVLIFAPLAVSRQTIREGKKFGIAVSPAESQDDIKGGIYITNYEKLHRFDLTGISGIVLDESSILKSYDGKFKSTIIEMTARIPYRLCCTATPAPNDFMELGNHSEFLGIMKRMEMLSMFFIHDSGSTKDWRIKGHAESKFWEWLSTWAVVIRKPSDLGYDDEKFKLPKVNYIEHIIKSDTVPDGMLFAMEANTLEERRTARRSSIGSRVKFISKIINKSDEQWIAWCNLNTESERLNEEIKGSVEITGSDSDEFKEKNMMGFSSGDVKKLVTKPLIAGFGMNWQNCHNVAFVGLSDSYEQFYQAVRRCWRFGQKKTVDVHIVLTEEEGSILKNIHRKEKDAEKMYAEMVNHMKELSVKEIHGAKNETVLYKEDMTKTEKWEMVLGDCVEKTRKIKSESIDFSIFSPPFSSLYTYSNSERDIGNCKDFSEFAKHFDFLIKELFRITKPGRSVSVHCMILPVSKQMSGEVQLRDFRGDIIRMFQAAGFSYYSEVCIWKDPVLAMQRTKALGLLYKQIKKDSCRSRAGLPDYLCTFRKPGENPNPVGHKPDDFPVSQWQKWASPVWMDINPSKVLHREKEDKDEKHICPLQLEVIERCVVMYSNPGDLVFSPFAGIGSEGYQSVKMGRRFMGIELKEAYYKQAIRNLKHAEDFAESGDLFAKPDETVDETVEEEI